jgi:anti-anti-sigma regulatory factor
LFSSLFARKDKPDPRKAQEAVLRGQIAPTSTTLRGPDTAAQKPPDPKELARLTAEKIDRIESEMIAAGMPVPPAPKNAQRAVPAAQVPVPSGKAPLDFSTSVVLGDTGNADQILVSGSTMEPQLEEAAILFANNQTEAAAATLRAAVVEPANKEQAWWMLFDVLHSLGDQSAYESLALDYAARFEASPPAWRNVAKPICQDVSKKPGVGPSVARFPENMDANIARTVETAHKASVNKRLVVFDFSRVKALDDAAARLLNSVLEGYKKQKRELRVVGAATLFELLRPGLVAGDKQDNEHTWWLALDMLRLLGERQQFDDLSIDYCVTFEVSPPSWEPMPAWIGAEEGEVLGGSTIHATVAPTQMDVAPLAHGGQAFVLAGEITGRMQKELAALRVVAQEKSDLVIDCRDLLRLDFIAAGELLNECVSLRGQGKQILIVEPSAIVLALMVVMGIHELTEIRARKH